MLMRVYVQWLLSVAGLHQAELFKLEVKVAGSM